MGARDRCLQIQVLATLLLFYDGSNIRPTFQAREVYRRIHAIVSHHHPFPIVYLILQFLFRAVKPSRKRPMLLSGLNRWYQSLGDPGEDTLCLSPDFFPPFLLKADIRRPIISKWLTFRF